MVVWDGGAASNFFLFWLFGYINIKNKFLKIKNYFNIFLNKKYFKE
jgi:hypothetical protein